MTPAASSHPVTVAAIDIGTNTVLLLVARVDPDGTIHPLVYEQRVPRLGRGVDASRRLAPEAMERVVSVLEEYRRLMAPYAPAGAAVFGTSAVRDASNRGELAALISRRTGFSLEILAGEEEALLTYRGAISGVHGIDAATVVDIGGGSTEITSGSAGRILGSVSLDIGSVRLTERFFRHNPPGEEEIEAARRTVRGALETVASPPSGSVCVAVAGTATTLALLAQGRREFSLEAVSGYRLEKGAVASLSAGLAATSTGEILARGAYMEGRHDIITAGAMILEEILARFGFEAVTVSERGVRYGVALREAERLRKRDESR